MGGYGCGQQGQASCRAWGRRPRAGRPRARSQKILSALSADSRLRPLVSAPSDPVPGCPSFHRKMRELTVRLRPSFVEQRGRCVDAFACAARGDRDGDGSVRVLAGESGRVKQCATQARQQKAETAETGRAKTETEAETSTSQRTTRAPVCPRAIYTPSGVGCVQPGTLQSRCGRHRRPSSPGRGTPFVAGPRDRACTVLHVSASDVGASRPPRCTAPHATRPPCLLNASHIHSCPDKILPQSSAPAHIPPQTPHLRHVTNYCTQPHRASCVAAATQHTAHHRLMRVTRSSRLPPALPNLRAPSLRVSQTHTIHSDTATRASRASACSQYTLPTVILDVRIGPTTRRPWPPPPPPPPRAVQNPESRIQIRPVTGQCMPDSAPITSRVPSSRGGGPVPRFLRHARNRNGEQWTVNTKYSESDASPRPTLTKPTLFFVHTAAFGSGTLFVFVFVRAFWVCILPRPAPVSHNSRLAHAGCLSSWIRIVSLVCLSSQLRGRIYVPSSEPSLGVGSCKFTKTKTSLKHTPVSSFMSTSPSTSMSPSIPAMAWHGMAWYHPSTEV